MPRCEDCDREVEVMEYRCGGPMLAFSGSLVTVCADCRCAHCVLIGPPGRAAAEGQEVLDLDGQEEAKSEPVQSDG